MALGSTIRSLRTGRCWSQDELADRLRQVAGRPTVTRETISRWESGRITPGPYWRAQLALVLGVAEDDLMQVAATVVEATEDDELAALELVRRASASDVGTATVERLELVVDDLAVAYPGTPPLELLDRTRRHLSYVERLLDSRMTLAEHQRLLVVAGWLCLLAATSHIDLHAWPAARARLRTAAQLAEQTGHIELAAWCLETTAWQVLTGGDYRRAVELAQGAQALAPAGSSALIQATAQEGRAWARLGAGPETRDALARVERLVSPLVQPDRPEHHYRYDPAKSDAYLATTLSWLGDPAAVPYARGVLARLESTADGPPRPRRAASARLDLALALVPDAPDEAAHLTLEAIESGRLVPSNYWRAAEVVQAVESRAIPGAGDIRQAYRELCEPARSDV